MRFELETAVWGQEKRTLVVFTVANLKARSPALPRRWSSMPPGGSGEGLTTATCWTENNPIARLCHVRL